MSRVPNGSSSKWHREESSRDFPGGPVVKTALPVLGTSSGFNLLLGTRSHVPCGPARKENNFKKGSGWDFGDGVWSAVEGR